MSDKKRKVKAQGPIQFTGIKLEPAKEYAAGLKAVNVSINHVRLEAGTFRGLKVLNKMNQQRGIDCPGCAWPDPEEDRSVIGEYCENGAKAIAEETTLKRVTPDFFAKHSVEHLSEWSDYQLGKSGRLTHPMVLKEDSSHYEPISWEAAFEMIGNELRRLNDADESIFYTSGRTSNEAAYLYQLFARHFGTNNLPDCSNMCHESSGKALSETVGIGKGSVKLDDFYKTELVVVIGQNPGTNHPRMLSALQKSKHNGAKIMTINPLKEAGMVRFKNPQEASGIIGKGTKLTDIFIPVRVNGDVAFLKGVMKLMLEEEERYPNTVFNHAFIQEKTAGFDAFLEDLKKVDLTECVEQSGVSLAHFKQAAQAFIDHEKIIICWAMGLTQHENGVANIQEVVNLLLLKGSIGKEGAGTCPVRGHSNVQGDRTMGIWEVPKPVFMDNLEREFGFVAPRKTGFNTVEAIKAMHEGQAKVFIAMGGNFISATPDTEYTASAIQNCELTVQVSTKLNRSHVVTGKKALILPCLGRTEIDRQKSGPQFVSVENSMGQVHSSEGILEPASEQLKSEPAIIAEMATHCLKDQSKLDWMALVDNYDLIRTHIQNTIAGFDDYNVRVRTPNGFYLPNGAREGQFNTPNGKANFTVHPLPKHDLAEDEFIMMTIRSHDQYNTTIYGLNDRYRGIFNERRVILMNENDMKSLELSKLDKVNLTSYFNGKSRVAECFLVIPYDIPLRCTATYFPEANVLVPIDSVAKKSHTPTSKYVKIKISKWSA